jgi:uncharacterized membrane protein
MAGHPSMTLYHRLLGRHAPSMRRAVTVLTVCALAALAMARFLPWELAAVLGWDLAGIVFLGSVWHVILGADAAHVERLANREDETRGGATALLATVCTASLFSVGYALGAAGHRTGFGRVLLISVSIATVAISWIVLNTVYTLRYAHLYYGQSGHGIVFRDGDSPPPTYRDFAYVAFTVGMTYQVSDTALRDPRLRRTVLGQALLSYIFGAFIVAGAVNLIAGLVR